MIDSVVKQCKRVDLWIIAGFMLVLLLAIQITSNTVMLTGLMVCVLYFLASTWVYAALRKKTTKTSPTKLTGFYLMAMTVKFFVRILAVLAYRLIVRTRTQVVTLAAMFSICYLAMIIYDATYSSRVEKKNQVSIKKRNISNISSVY